MKSYIIINKAEYKLLTQHVRMVEQGVFISVFNHEEVSGVRFADELNIEIPYGTYLKITADNEGSIHDVVPYDIGILLPCHLQKQNNNKRYQGYENSFIEDSHVLCFTNTIN